MPAYAKANGVLARFDTDTARDAWVDAAPDFREAIRGGRRENETVDRIETLSEHGLARWREVQDPDADVVYGIPDRVIPAEVADLPPVQAQAYWLCDHEDGPGGTQVEAAWLLQTSQGSVWTHLKRAREKLDSED